MSRYKEKTCPTCGTVHKKQGPYCSRSCGNHRTFTKKERAHLSIKQSEHMMSPNGAEQRALSADLMKLEKKKQLNRDDADLQALKYEDLFVQPVVRELDDNQFIAGGDLWTDA
jgi:predicted ATP-dependent serine protease